MKYLELGTIINTHGLIGEIKFLCNYYGYHFLWKEKTIIYLKENKNIKKLVILKIRKINKFILLKFENLNDIKLVEKMKGQKLIVNINELINYEFSLFFKNIINYKTFDAQNNKYLGKVIALINNNHQGLWKIKTNNNVFFIPNNKIFINKIDNYTKKVYFNIIEGLISNV